jgi:hypothetical protein
MNYPEWLDVLEGTAGGDSVEGEGNSDDGTWEPTPGEKGKPGQKLGTWVDVQEMGRRVTLSPTGEKVFVERVVAFPENESDVNKVAVGDPCVVTYRDKTTRAGKILAVSKIDGSLDLDLG